MGREVKVKVGERLRLRLLHGIDHLPFSRSSAVPVPLKIELRMMTFTNRKEAGFADYVVSVMIGTKEHMVRGL